jgi:hypothetical protein
MTQIGDALGRALGCDVTVLAGRNGYRAQISFESVDDALELVRRIRVRAVA